MNCLYLEFCENEYDIKLFRIPTSNLIKHACGAVGRAVASNTRDPRSESNRW